MTVWQYAQLSVTYDNRLAAGDNRWTTAWHGPDATTQGTAGSYDRVVAELNRVGTEGWELVDVAALDAGESGRFPDGGDWSLTRYTFKRPRVPTAAKSSELVQKEVDPRPWPTEVGQFAHSTHSGLVRPRQAESVALVTLTAYRLPDVDPARVRPRLLPPNTGRLLIELKVARPHAPDDLVQIERLRTRYESQHDRRDEIKAAAAQYAASCVQAQWDSTWWTTPSGFPFSKTADLLNGSAKWLCNLVEHSLEDAASWAGAKGPVVSIGAGVTANLATVQVTGPLDNAARVCEISGIVVGAATGAHPLVIACAKGLARDELGSAIEEIFKKLLDSRPAEPFPRSGRQTADEMVRRAQRLTRGREAPPEEPRMRPGGPGIGPGGPGV